MTRDGLTDHEAALGCTISDIWSWGPVKSVTPDEFRDMYPPPPREDDGKEIWMKKISI